MGAWGRIKNTEKWRMTLRVVAENTRQSNKHALRIAASGVQMHIIATVSALYTPRQRGGPTCAGRQVLKHHTTPSKTR